MFSQVEGASSAMVQSGVSMSRNLQPGLSSCPQCRKTRVIAGPTLHTCEDCGVQHIVASRQ